MLMTIGVMVGFVLGFILFLSRLPEERYTLVETERAIEEYKTTEASQFAFYDNLSDVENAVPSVEVDDIQDFKRSRSEGKYGAGSNERAGAVQMAEELSVIDGLADGVNPLSVPAGNAVQVIAKNNLSTAQPSVQPSGKTKTVREPTVVKKIHNKPSTSFYLQAGAFTKSSDAERMKERVLLVVARDFDAGDAGDFGRIGHRTGDRPVDVPSKGVRHQLVVSGLGSDGLGGGDIHRARDL